MVLAHNNSYNTNEDGNLELQELKKREKEILVKKLHKNKILLPTEKYPYFKTRIPGNKQIVKKTYDEVIEALYSLYYEPTVRIPTLREAAKEWISSREEKKTIEYTTAKHYRADFERYISHLPIADMPITKISKNQLFSAFESIIGDGSDIFKKAMTNTKTVINGAFDYANMLEGVECIDAKRVKISDLVKKCQNPASEEETYTSEEADALFNYLESLPPTVYSLGIRLMFCLSIRIGELKAITWDDYDENGKTLHLCHSMVTKKDGAINCKAMDVNYMKAHSDKGKRTLELSDYAVYLLSELKKINGEKRYILQSKGSLPISTNNFNDQLKAYCEQCGIIYKSSHKIRFYACSAMYEQGYDEKTIQDHMGHNSLAMTRHYDRRQKKDVDRDLVNRTFGRKLPSSDGSKRSISA